MQTVNMILFMRLGIFFINCLLFDLNEEAKSKVQVQNGDRLTHSENLLFYAAVLAPCECVSFWVHVTLNPLWKSFFTQNDHQKIFITFTVVYTWIFVQNNTLNYVKSRKWRFLISLRGTKVAAIPWSLTVDLGNSGVLDGTTRMSKI